MDMFLLPTFFSLKSPSTPNHKTMWFDLIVPGRKCISDFLAIPKICSKKHKVKVDFDFENVISLGHTLNREYCCLFYKV